MKANLLRAASLFCLCLSTLAWAADDGLRQYGATATVTPQGSDGLQRIELPLAVLQASRSDGVADLRLFDASGTPLPLAWAQAQAVALPTELRHALPRFAWPKPAPAAPINGGARIEISAAGAVVRIHGATPLASTPVAGATQWLLDLSAAPRNAAAWQRVVLDWPRRDGGLSTRVRVEASDDARQWRAVTHSALLELDGTADAAAPSQKAIDWPAAAGQPKYLRLALDTPLVLSGSELVTRAPSAVLALPTQRVTFTADADAALRAWTLDLKGRVPLARLQLQLPQPNSVAALRLQQRQDDKSAWQTVSSFVAWRLTRDAQDTVSSAVDVAAGAARYWRLLADDRAPLPAAASLEATISWRQPSLVFVARDARGLQIAVGRDKAPSRALPLATLMPDYQDGAEYKLPLATVGDVVAQTVATPGLPERLRDASSEDRRRWLLWAVLALAVIGLAVLALRLARDVKAAPPH